MKDMPMEHIDDDTIIKYIEQTLSSHEADAVDDHLEDCHDCAERLRAAFEFEQALDLMTIRSRGGSFKQVYVATALARAEKTASDPKVRERLAEWLRTWSGRAEAAFGVVLNASDQATQIVIENAESLIKPNPKWTFAYGLEGERGTGRGRTSEYKTRVEAVGQSETAIEIDEDDEEIRIDLQLADMVSPPLAVLITDAGDQPPEVVQLTPVSGGNRMAATFSKLKPGRYTLLVEPIE